jgi:hypothetical protein
MTEQTKTTGCGPACACNGSPLCDCPECDCQG